MLKDWLITTETVVHTLTVDLKEGTAVGLVETIYYGPKRLGKRLIHSTSIACMCHDIYRRHLTWTEANSMSDLLPKYNTAKSLSRRLRTELNKLVAEGKVHGESISGNQHRQPIAGQQ